LFYTGTRKLSADAKQTGICYRTAWRWFKAEKLSGFQANMGTTIVTDPTPEKARVVALTKTAIYTRVSAAENKANLEGQAKRLQDYCAAKGYQVAAVVKEIGSGVNDTRPKLMKLLTDPTLTLIVVEHKDRLTRFGFNYIEQLLKRQDRRIEVVNLAENGKEDLIQDFVSIVTSFCARLYGHRRSKRKTERIIAELQNGEEGDHPSQTRPGQPKQTRKAR
jgi:putative resolvase